MYVVMEGSDAIMYTPNSDLENLATFLDLNTPQPVSALAMEDTGQRGVFDSGDKILYALAGSPAIYRVEFGTSPTFLTANGFTFDGSTTLNLDHLNGDMPDFELGNLTALSVASFAGSRAIPNDRIFTDLGIVPESSTVILMLLGVLAQLPYGLRPTARARIKNCHASLNN
jgi:hypothetical protein